MDFITFRCTACQHGMKVGADKAGRKAKCPKCQTELLIPKSEAVVAAGAPAPVPDKPAEEDDEYKVGGSYNVLIDPQEEEKKRLAAEAEKNKKKEKKKAPRIEIKVKELKDKKKWLQVRRSIPLFLAGTGVWGGAWLLSTLVVVIGLFASSNYVDTANELLLERVPPDAPPGFVQSADPLTLSLGLVAGVDSSGTARVLHILALVLVLIKGGLFLTGYLLAAPVPDRYGTRGQIKLLIILCCINLVLVLAFRILPLCGLFTGWIPLLTPEVAMTEANVSRALPLHVFWSFSGFWVELFTQIILFIQYLEPIIFGVFFWTVGVSMKEDDLAEAGLGLSKIGFGVSFLLLSYHVMSCCGTSDVLVMVLRIVYFLWVCFSAGWIYRFVTVMLLARDTLDKRIYGVIHADDVEDEDGDEDVEDDEEED